MRAAGRQCVATNNNSTSVSLVGYNAMLAAQPLNPAVRGGLQYPAPGVHQSPDDPQDTGPDGPADAEPQSPFAGKGDLLEQPDGVVFRAIDALVQRQEPLARSRLAQDTHWTYQKLGYTWSSLEKVQNSDIYIQAFPPGTQGLRISAVPNKAADLCNKLTETLLVDRPRPNPEAENDSEQAERGAELAKEFLEQDGSEAGTDDAAIFWALVEGATTRASTFASLWIDKTGGGSIPLQIKAHPLAESPANPLVGPDGQPTNDYVLRYVTEAGQFTDNPAEAARQWLPKIRVDKYGREHVRLYPEYADLNTCRAYVGLFFTTVGEAKRRWPETVGAMSDTQIGQLCDWMPTRYIVLLPPALRSRWRLQTGNAHDPKGGSNDERILFFYEYGRKPEPAYPEGALLHVSGAFGGYVLGKDTLAAEVEVPSERQQDQMVTDKKLLDLPLVQMRLLQDPDERDPMGTAFMGRIGAAGEAGATLATAWLEAIDIYLHPARFATATSPLSAQDVEESRALGKFATVISPQDFPKYEEPRPLPPQFLPTLQWQYQQMDSIAGLNAPAQGSDDAKEVSGVARRIAVQQSLVALSRMQQAVNSAHERYWRLKLQLAMKGFTVPQLIRYAGPDSAFKEQWFAGNDFARVGNVTMLTGTGSMMTPTDKVNYVAELVAMGFMDPAEAADAARPAFAKALGIPDNPHLQRVERQISSWLEGPPAGWAEAQAQYVQAVAVHSRESQMLLAADPQAVLPPPPPAPFTPFDALPVDAEPAVAALRQRRLGNLMAEVAFTEQPPEWRELVIAAYAQAQAAANPAPMLPAAPGAAPGAQAVPPMRENPVPVAG